MMMIPEKSRIRQMFDYIAPDYDKLNRLMSFGLDVSWRRKAIDEIGTGNTPLQVLDIASGTADFALDAARRLPKGSHIVGVDISEQMLAVGRNKIRAAGRQEQIFLQTADAEALPFADETFDCATVAFGVRNFEHLQQGLLEMHRLLRPGGKVVILELSYPDSSFLLWGYKLYVLHVLPAVCGRLSGNKEAYRYLPQSILQFPKPANFLSLLKEAGFRTARARNFTFGVCRLYVAEK